MCCGSFSVLTVIQHRLHGKVGVERSFPRAEESDSTILEATGQLLVKNSCTLFILVLQFVSSFASLLLFLLAAPVQLLSSFQKPSLCERQDG